MHEWCEARPMVTFWPFYFHVVYYEAIKMASIQFGPTALPLLQTHLPSCWGQKTELAQCSAQISRCPNFHCNGKTIVFFKFGLELGPPALGGLQDFARSIATPLWIMPNTKVKEHFVWKKHTHTLERSTRTTKNRLQHSLCTVIFINSRHGKMKANQNKTSPKCFWYIHNTKVTQKTSDQQADDRMLNRSSQTHRKRTAQIILYWSNRNGVYT